MLHTLHIITNLNVGGAEVSLYRMLKSFGGRVHSTVVCLGAGGPLVHSLREIGTDVIVLDLFRSPFRGILRLVHIIWQYKHSALICWLYHPQLIGSLLGRMLGVKKIIWAIRSTDLPKGANLTKIIRWMLSYLSNGFPDVILYNSFSGRDFHESIGFNRYKSFVIQNGFSLETQRLSMQEKFKLRRSLSIGDDVAIIGMFGRLSPEKGHDRFLNIAKKLLDAQSEKQPMFMMVGRDVELNNPRFSRIVPAEFDLDSLRAIGEQKDIRALMQICDVVCITSESEAFPNVLAEAMLCEIPVISTDCGDARYIVKDLAPIISLGSDDQYVDQLLDLINLEKAKKSILGAKLRDRICSDFSIDRMIEKYVDVFEK